MNGRKLYDLFKPLLLLTAYFLKIFPQAVRIWLWKLADLLPSIFSVGLRWSIANANGVELGDNVYFGHNVTVKNWHRLVIGNNVSIHENCFIDASGGVSIGSNVSIAHGASIVSFDHDYSNPQVPIKYADLIPEKIIMGNDIWVSAGVRILRGSTIGDRCVVAANAVVRGKLDGGSIYGGVPVKKLKDIGHSV